MFRIINVSERTCKLTWSGSWSSINGTGTVYYLPEGATLYASPYLVVTPQGYTKHYYAEAERITSQLGKGQFADVGTPVVGDSLVQVKLQEVTGNVEPPATLTAPATPYFSYLDTLTDRQDTASTLFFYHPDHLGSSSWITYTDGEAVQHLHYLPWGEEFVDQRITDFSARHTFSAKERDTETGLSYFGARYYSSDLSIWLSVDPMSDKYPSLSPYVYCADNPVKLVDPNGEDPIYAKNFWGNVKKIGDNGQCESNSYLVLGDKVKEVKAATKSGKFYTGDLSPSDMVIHIPTGQIQQDIQLTVDQSLKSGNSPENRVEYGGHSLFGDKTARFWDPGTPTQTTTYNGVTIQKRTIEPFKIGGKGALIGGPPEKVQYIWHVHTCSSVPSSLDYEKMDSWRKAGFKGCAIVVCPNDSGVSFYNERGTLVRIHYEDFKKMGRQEDIQ